MTLLIAGLGNPGTAYDDTRHNIGFRVLKTIARKNGWVFRHAASLNGDVAQGRVNDAKVILLLPVTYMNCSGQAVRLCVDYFKIAPSSILIVSDDVNLPFGKLRLREKGTGGGHKGLKSVEEHLGTQDYNRLRIGIDGAELPELEEYVLGHFTAEECVQLPQIVEDAIAVVEKWINNLRGIEQC